MPLNGECTNLEKIRVNYTAQNASGGDAVIDGALRVEVISGDGTAVVDPALPLQVQFLSGDEEGVDTVYKVIGDADLDVDGVVEISDEFTLHTTFQNASALSGVVMPPEPK